MAACVCCCGLFGGLELGIRLLHLHLHGLFRSRDLELGRDADTGGQTLYVLDLVRSLAQRQEVEQVDVVTRLIQDRRVDVSYSQPVEIIAPGARILRLPFGPKRYLRKELLWPHLEDLADQLVQHLSQPGQGVDWIHAHYADAGFVGALVSQRLGIPLVFTGHSLGREKQRRLMAGGCDREQIEQTYAISRRIVDSLQLAHSALILILLFLGIIRVLVTLMALHIRAPPCILQAQLHVHRLVAACSCPWVRRSRPTCSRCHVSLSK